MSLDDKASESEKVEFQITPALAAELHRLSSETNLSVPQLFSKGLTLVRLLNELYAKKIRPSYIDESGLSQEIIIPGITDRPYR